MSAIKEKSFTYPVCSEEFDVILGDLVVYRGVEVVDLLLDLDKLLTVIYLDATLLRRSGRQEWSLAYGCAKGTSIRKLARAPEQVLCLDRWPVFGADCRVFESFSPWSRLLLICNLILIFWHEINLIHFRHL